MKIRKVLNGCFCSIAIVTAVRAAEVLTPYNLPFIVQKVDPSVNDRIIGTYILTADRNISTDWEVYHAAPRQFGNWYDGIFVLQPTQRDEATMEQENAFMRTVVSKKMDGGWGASRDASTVTIQFLLPVLTYDEANGRLKTGLASNFLMPIGSPQYGWHMAWLEDWFAATLENGVLDSIPAESDGIRPLLQEQTITCEITGVVVGGAQRSMPRKALASERADYGKFNPAAMPNMSDVADRLAKNINVHCAVIRPSAIRLTGKGASFDYSLPQGGGRSSWVAELQAKIREPLTASRKGKRLPLAERQKLGELLYQAAQQGDYDGMEEALLEGAAVTWRPVKEDTSVMMVWCMTTGKAGSSPIVQTKGVKLLLEYGASAAPSVYRNPLGPVVNANNLDAAVLLLRAGADVNAAIGTGDMTVLMAAAGRGHTEMVKLLLAAGANPAVTESLSHKTAEQIALAFGFKETADVIRMFALSAANVTQRPKVVGAASRNFSATANRREPAHAASSEQGAIARREAGRTVISTPTNEQDIGRTGTGAADRTDTKPTPEQTPNSVQAALGGRAVLYGRSGPKDEDRFTLKNVRIEMTTMTAEYWEDGDKCAYVVSGPLTDRAWKFRGGAFVKTPAGAVAKPSSYSATVELSSDGKMLQGTYKWTGLAAILAGSAATGRIVIDCSGNRPD